jgi:hypothetical protein
MAKSELQSESMKDRYVEGYLTGVLVAFACMALAAWLVL